MFSKLKKFYNNYLSVIMLFISLSMSVIFAYYSWIGNYILFVLIFTTLYIEIDNRKEFQYQIELNNKLYNIQNDRMNSLIEGYNKTFPNFDINIIENDVVYLLIRMEIRNIKNNTINISDCADKIIQKPYNADYIYVAHYKKI